MNTPRSFAESAPSADQSYELVVEALGFDMGAHMDRLNGLAVEVAGPTEAGSSTGLAAYPVWSGFLPPEKLYITNRYVQNDRLDVQLNAGELPFTNGSLRLLAASSLPDFELSPANLKGQLHIRFMNEAKRCLEPGGVLVMTNFAPDTLQHARWLGLTTIRSILQHRGEFWDAVFINAAADPAWSYRTTRLATN